MNIVMRKIVCVIVIAAMIVGIMPYRNASA